MNYSILPPVLQRDYCLRALNDHTALYERAYADLQKATTEAERANAQLWIDSASDEIAYWQKALEEARA